MLIWTIPETEFDPSNYYYIKPIIAVNVSQNIAPSDIC